MSSLIAGIRHVRQQFNPPRAAKSDNPLKFGILGTANIAPVSLVIPARTHPHVVVYAIAARDKARATAFALKYGICRVHDDYQALLDDPEVDVVYIPLPNALHLEWSTKALSRGKHVLVEKPSVANAAEAEILFSHHRQRPSPQRQAVRPPPVLLEAFHFRFHPAWRLFMAHVDRPRVHHVHAAAAVPGRFVPPGDIRFQHDLAGGALMDIGCYCVDALRLVYGAEPEGCVESSMGRMPPPRERCDGDFRVVLAFPDAAAARAVAPLRAGGGGGDGGGGGGGEEEATGRRRIGVAEGGLRAPLITGLRLPRVEVVHAPVVSETEACGGLAAARIVTTVVRRVVFWNFMFPHLYHRIDDEAEVVVEKVVAGGTGREGSTRQLISRATTKDTAKAYTFREMGVDEPGEEYWSSYRYMLQQFVNRVRGSSSHPETGWVGAEDSVAQMRIIDLAYEKAGLGARPSGGFAKKMG